MTPNFTIILIGGILFALPVLAYIWWRFGGPDTLAFIIISGGFTAVMDFISSFVVQNYEYPVSLSYGPVGARGEASRPGVESDSAPDLWRNR